jgi:peptidyl-prolyl cis-trans isomerase B (cyclophilin B)
MAFALLLCLTRVGDAVLPSAPSAQSAPQNDGSKSGANESPHTPSSGQSSGTAPSSDTPTQEKEAPAASETAESKPRTAAPDDAKAKSANEYAPIYAIFKSMSGEIRVKLHIAESPRTCANFINLVQRGYYIRKPWEDFTPVVRQLGPPLPPNAIPYSIPLEHSPKHMFDVGGRLCLANTSDDPGARGHPCRIFITVKPQERWNLNYVIFGTVDRGLEIAKRLTEGELIQEIRIESDREGEIERFLKAHERSISKWNAALEKQPLP